MAVAISKHCESKNKTVLQVAYEKGSVSKSSSGFEEARTSHVGENVGAREGVPVQSWSSLFSMPVKTGGPLQFYKPHRVDGKMVVRPPVEVVNEGIDLWKGCLVGQFLDKRLPFPVVRSLVNRLWGKKEMPDISTTENGLFFFRFRDPEARDWVMDNGPWNLAGRPFILRAWKPGMDMLNIQLSTVPIWVKFYNIPLEYWTSTGLGYIASTVGIPLHLDALTENQTKLSFARICIEVGVDCEFPKSVLLDRGNGNLSTIRIVYPWAPQCCPVCRRFGHNLENCQVHKGPDSLVGCSKPGNNTVVAIYDSAVQNNARVAEVIDDGRWNWPIANSADLLDIKNRCVNYHIDTTREDIISWLPTPSGTFTVKSAWNLFRLRSPEVSWHYTVWFPQAIRRHAFIGWVTIQDRLTTQDKLLKWGLKNSISCVFCRASVEDRNHLFFGCQFTAGIWKRILRFCGNIRHPRNWENEFLWVTATKGKSFCAILKRIAWGATIYHLWRQRNSRVYENIFNPADAIFHIICNDVRLRVSSFQKVADNPRNRAMCERWSLPLNILVSGSS